VIRAIQGLSALTVLALLLGQLAAVGHYVLVAHYFCAQHGTMHHGRAPSHSVLAPHQRRASVSRAAIAAHDAHDECAFPARHRDATEPPMTAARPVLHSTPPPIWIASTTSSIAPAISLLSQAPKQSPPIRA